ncbi:MAG: hypothetical protein IJ391_02295 [Clostridia bacterium]|nr:hypothetical protein [Clostridia bacterium]
MNRIIIKALFFAAFALLLCINVCAVTDTDGYTLISTSDEFLAVADDLDGNYRLAGDIDLADTEFKMIGSIDDPFTGNFDGAGYSVKNIKITASDDADLYAAVFVSNEGTITNVVFDGITVSAGSSKSVYAAAVAARNIGDITEVTVQNSTVTARSGFYSARAAAITAYNYRLGSISTCTTSAEIKAVSLHMYSSAAGVAAVNLGDITGCVNNGSITSNALFDYAVADGIVAEGDGSVTECESTGDIYTGTEEILLGDVDGDSSITPTDGVVLSRYLASWAGYEDTIVKAASDVDENGSIEPTDGVILSRYLANWSGYEVLPYKN